MRLLRDCIGLIVVVNGSFFLLSSMFELID